MAADGVCMDDLGRIYKVEIHVDEYIFKVNLVDKKHLKKNDGQQKEISNGISCLYAHNGQTVWQKKKSL